MTQYEDKKARLIKLLTSLGDSQMERKNYTGAIEHYEKILGFGIEEPIIFTSLSKAYIQLDRYDTKALNIYRKTLNYDPDNLEVCDYLSKYYLRIKRRDDEAVKVFNQAIKLKSNNVKEIVPTLINMYLEQDEIASAIRVAIKGLNFTEVRDVALNYFVELSIQNQEFDSAIEVLKHNYRRTRLQDFLIGFGRILVEKHAWLASQGKVFLISNEEKEFCQSLLQSELLLHQVSDVQFVTVLSRIIYDTQKDKYNSLGFDNNEFEFFLTNLNPIGVLKEGFSGRINYKNQNLDFYNLIWSRLNQSKKALSTNISSPSFKKIITRKQSLLGLALKIKNAGQLFLNFKKEKAYTLITETLFTLGQYLNEKYPIQLAFTSDTCLILTRFVPEFVAETVELLRFAEKEQQKRPPTEKCEISISLHFFEGQDIGNAAIFEDFSLLLQLNELPGINNGMNQNELNENRLLVSNKLYQAFRNNQKTGYRPLEIKSLGQLLINHHLEPQDIFQIEWIDPIARLKAGMLKKLGRFELVDELDSGENFSVYKGQDTQLERLVLLKAIRDSGNSKTSRPKSLPEKFLEEARKIGKLDHRNIILIYDVGNSDGFSYLAREYFEGQNLRNFTPKFDNNGIKRLIRIFIQICSALKYAHQSKISHNNLKPNNIIISANDEVKLTDFGIFHNQIKLSTTSNFLIDNLPYQSPEQIVKRPLDFRADIYSLGVILYEVLVGQKPFQGKNSTEIKKKILRIAPKLPSKINPQIPKGFDKIIYYSLSKRKTDRYSNVHQMMHDFYSLISKK